MFEAATGEGGGEEAAAARADTERPEKLSDCCEPFVQNRGKNAEKVWVLNRLTGKSVGVKTPISPTGVTPLCSLCVKRLLPGSR